MGFEGATKRNKPELKIGDVVYCRVSLAHKDLETELTCISASGSKKGWSSGEAVCLTMFVLFLLSKNEYIFIYLARQIYGQLSEGLLVHVSTGFAKHMLRPDSVLLNVLGRYLLCTV